MFNDRIDAAYQLVEALQKYKEEAVVLAIPRGGVPIGHIIANELNWPLDVVLTKKIGHPFNKEFAIGAVSLCDYFVSEDIAVSPGYLAVETDRIQATLQEQYNLYMGDRQPVDLYGRTAVIVDDGVATGNTLISTVQMIRKKRPEKIVIAVPVASPRSIAKLSELADDVVCPLIPAGFKSVSQFYVTFSQVTDEEVVQFLHETNNRGASGRRTS